MRIFLRFLAICTFVLAALQSHAQWVKTNFPTSMPNKMFVTSAGRLVVGEFSKLYTGSEEGGLYWSADLGDTWEKADVPNYNFAAFAEADGCLYAFGEDAKVLKTSDFSSWETITYGHVYEEGAELIECYAAAYYKDRIYCAPLGLAPAYSADGGKTWTLTDGTGLDLYGGVWLYGMVVYKDRLYAYGGDGIFCLNEDLNSWTCVKQAFYAMNSAVHQDRLYIGFDVQGSPYPAMYSDDGTDWQVLEIPEDYTDYNSIGSICGVDNTLFIGSMKGLFCTTDMQTWKDVSEGFPKENETYANPYVKPAYMLSHEGHVFASGFDMTTDQGGVFKLDISAYVGNEAVEVTGREVLLTGRHLLVKGAGEATVRIFKPDGSGVCSIRGNQVDLSFLDKGMYLYSVQAGHEILTGKFIVW